MACKNNATLAAPKLVPFLPKWRSLPQFAENMFKLVDLTQT